MIRNLECFLALGFFIYFFSPFNKTTKVLHSFMKSSGLRDSFYIFLLSFVQNMFFFSMNTLYIFNLFNFNTYAKNMNLEVLINVNRINVLILNIFKVSSLNFGPAQVKKVLATYEPNKYWTHQPI